MAESTQGEVLQSDAKNEITFKCRFCERSLPLKEMTVIARFFPPLVACRECEIILG